MLDKIIGNPIIRNAAFGTLKKAFQEHNLKAIIVRMDEQGELQFDLKEEPGEYIPAVELDKYRAAYIKFLTNGSTLIPSDQERP